MSYYAGELTLCGSKLLFYMSEELHAQKHTWDSNRHSNANYELHIILRGACTVDVEARHFAVESQHAILIAPGYYHCPKTTPGDFERFSLSFSISEGSLPTALRNTVPSSKVFPITEKITAHCRDIFSESTAGNPFRHEMLKAQLIQLLLMSFRQLHIMEDTKMSLYPVDHIIRTELIDNFFHDHFAEHAAEEQLARKLHLSRRQLARVIQENYGMNFREKLISARMDHAAWILRTTDRRVGEIANLVGYSSEAGFYQVFRRHFGTTPQKYRLLNKNQKDGISDLQQIF